MDGVCQQVVTLPAPWDMGWGRREGEEACKGILTPTPLHSFCSKSSRAAAHSRQDQPAWRTHTLGKWRLQHYLLFGSDDLKSRKAPLFFLLFHRCPATTLSLCCCPSKDPRIRRSVDPQFLSSPLGGSVREKLGRQGLFEKQRKRDRKLASSGLHSKCWQHPELELYLGLSNG